MTDAHAGRGSHAGWRDSLGTAGLVGAAAAATMALVTGAFRKRDADTGEDNGSSEASGGAAREKSVPAWGAGAEQLEAIASRGAKLYEINREMLEAEHAAKCVFFNVDNGQFVVGDTFGETHRKFRERFGDAPSWDARIGDAHRVIDRRRFV